MLAATYTQGANFCVQDMPAPDIGAKEILLRVRASSICATDVKITRHGHRKLKPGQRIVLGHEFVGDIVARGKDVKTFMEGQRVGVAPNIGCGVCDSCIQGLANYCPDYSALGINLDGGHAEFIKIPADFVQLGNVALLPKEIPDQEAALLEPFSCVVASLRNAKIELGETVLIYGAGPMGLLHVALCALSGAAQIVVIDPLAKRLEKARELGATLTLDPTTKDVKKTIMDMTNGRGANVAFVACPIAKVQDDALALMAPAGRLCLFSGLPAGSPPVPLETNAVHYRNIAITGTTGGSVRDYRDSMRLVASRRVRLDKFIASTFPLKEVDSAYKLALAGVEGKVVLLG